MFMRVDFPAPLKIEALEQSCATNHKYATPHSIVSILFQFYMRSNDCMFCWGCKFFIIYRKSTKEGTCFSLSNPPKNDHLYSDTRSFCNALFSLFAAKLSQTSKIATTKRGFVLSLLFLSQPSRIMSIKDYVKVLATQTRRSQMITYWFSKCSNK